MRFLPPIAALADGTVHFDGDQQAYARPMDPILAHSARRPGRRRVTSVPPHRRSAATRGTVTFDASASSQFLSGLLLVGARYADGIDIRHVGPETPPGPTSR